MEKDKPVTGYSIQCYPNGGYTLIAPHDGGYAPNNIGAYSDAEDLLEALRGILIGKEK